MIVVLGASGYVGGAFVRALEMRGVPYLPVSRQQSDYTNFATLSQLLRDARPDFLINAAGFTGKPNVDACEVAQTETLLGNALLPQTISNVCQAFEIPWGHVSSGCIYSGAFLRHDNTWTVARDLAVPTVRQLIERRPEDVRGFAETDAPNFCWRSPPCSFYSGTKALAEEALAMDPRVFVWRLRIPFHQVSHPRNYLTKLQRYPKVYDNINSLSHLDDTVAACLDLWNLRAPFGVYNVTNPGFVTTRQVVGLIECYVQPRRSFVFWENDLEFYQKAAQAPRSNCILDTSKLLATGVRMRSVEDALADSLQCWQAKSQPLESVCDFS